jgi:hypothetical protein
VPAAVLPSTPPLPSGPPSEPSRPLSPGIDFSAVGLVGLPSTLSIVPVGSERLAPVRGVVGWISVFRPITVNTCSPAGTLGALALARKRLPCA